MKAAHRPIHRLSQTPPTGKSLQVFLERRELWREWAKTGTSGGYRRPPSLTLWTRRACWGNGRWLCDPAIATLSETTDRCDRHQRPGEKQQYRNGCRVHCVTSVITPAIVLLLDRPSTKNSLSNWRARLVLGLPSPTRWAISVAFLLILLAHSGIKQDEESRNSSFRHL